MVQRHGRAGAVLPGYQTKLSGHLKILGIVLWLLAILTACASETPLPPTPTPTPTRLPARVNNQNVEALNAAQAALADMEFGFAPLLKEEQTRIVVESGQAGEVARLAYPLQPADPRDWSTGDSFIMAYAAQKSLEESPRVRRAALTQFSLSSSIDNYQDQVDHVAVMVRFMDGSQAVVDLSPLATSFGAQHPARELLANEASLASQFEEWRRGVSLNLLQPMQVVEEQGNVYYLLAKILISADEYEFSLRVHLTQTATPIRPLLLTRGTMVLVTIKRADFEAVRARIAAAGTTAFSQKPELTSRVGDPDPDLNAVLDSHLDLLWYLVTKFEPEGQSPRGTPAPTLTPTPTSTPTPTATRPRLPLITS